MNIIPNTLWEEKNLIEPEKNYLNKNEFEQNDTINDTKINSIPNQCKDTGIIKKKCSTCGINKELNEFYKFKKTTSKCKQCQRAYSKSYRINNKEKVKTYNTNYKKENKEELKKYNTAYLKNRYNTDTDYKLSCILRNRLNKALKGNYKSGSAVRDLSCTIDELKSYLESLFQPSMSWENYGKWHIDHKKPLDSFDLTDRKQLLEACHYTNLQPLWAIDNLRKNKY